MLMHDADYADLSPRSRLIATFAMCGFANVAALGAQTGVLSQVAPGRSGDVSRLAFSAVISGAISTFTSANLAGLLVTEGALDKVSHTLAVPGNGTHPARGNGTSAF